jgi:hypothetical protein
MKMKTSIIAAALTSLIMVNLAMADEAWIPLFNGRDLKEWTPKIKGYPAGENFGETFRVEDGLIKVRYDNGYDGAFKGRFGHLFYNRPFSNYVLRVEYRFVGEQLPDGPGWAKRNSGLMLHGQSPESMDLNQDFPVSIEYQLLGGSGKGKRTTANLCTPGTNIERDGKLYTPHVLNSTSETYDGDQWVTVEVEVRGSKYIKHLIDGKTVLEYQVPQYDPKSKDAKPLIEKNGGSLPIEGGTISIQSESAPCDYRKIEIRILK